MGPCRAAVLTCLLAVAALPAAAVREPPAPLKDAAAAERALADLAGKEDRHARDLARMTELFVDYRRAEGPRRDESWARYGALLDDAQALCDSEMGLIDAVNLAAVAAGLAGVAAALDAAHASGVVHRDLRPANIVRRASVHGSRLPRPEAGRGVERPAGVRSGTAAGDGRPLRPGLGPGPGAALPFRRGAGRGGGRDLDGHWYMNHNMNYTELYYYSSRSAMLRSITIHGMDPELAERLERLARESGLSLNKAIKKLLAGALGVDPSGADRRRSFAELCGKWSKEQAREFQKAVSDLERVEPEDWA